MDQQAIKNNITNSNQWTRILYMLLFGVILYLVMMVLCAVVVVQAIFALLTGNPNSEIRRFSGDLVRYLREIAAFLTYTCEAKPYPFQAWQSTASEGEIVDTEYETPDSEETPASEETEKPDTKSDV
tara:strand:+ start:844 stop:1224 length:381 start_codon:yes stop_codon:yes gene_type:complete